MTTDDNSTQLQRILSILNVSTMSDSNNSGHSAESLLDELDSYCRSASLSEDGLREIIERHELLLAPNNISRNINNYDFFLQACQNERVVVTEGIIRCILEYFPDATSAADNDDGCSPLHYACINKNITLNIIQLLIDAAPTTVRAVEDKGNVPLHYICGIF
jgi:ankyrin repeat protein